MSKKKKCKAKANVTYYGIYRNCDYHHILFQKKHWARGYAHTLREHPYCGEYIPKATLHRTIHSKIHDVPTPNSDVCRKAVEKLNEWLEIGRISLEDRLDVKIQVLADIFRDTCPATTAILDWQREVVSKFYSKEG